MKNRENASLLDINSVLLDTTNFKHTLHLYTPNVNKFTIQIPFLAMAGKKEKIIYITNEESESIINEFKRLDIEPMIIRPEDISNLKVESKDKARIVLDGATFDKNSDHLQHEKHLTEICKTGSILSNHSLLCTYIVTNIYPHIIKELSYYHDKLIFTNGNATVLSSESFDKLGITNETVERSVKKDLELISLALIMNQPMCGLDIIKVINKNFNVLVSPGTIYPLLHELEEKGLLECKLGIKKKVYKPAKGAEDAIKKILSSHVQISAFMNNFLQYGSAEKSNKVKEGMLA